MVPRGLATKAVSLTALRAVTIAAGLVLFGIHTAALLAAPPHDPWVLHGLTVCLIAIAVYAWLLLPFVTAAVAAAVTLASAAGAWSATGSVLLAWDVAAVVILVGVAGVQQRKRDRRMHRLRQQIDDLSEGLYLKAQEQQLAQQSHETLQRKLARYQQLHAIAEQLTRLVELGAIVQFIVEQTFGLIGKSDACLLFLVNKERQELALHASRRSPAVGAVHAKHGDQFDHYVLRTQRPLMVNDVRRDFRFTVTAHADRPIGSVIACPILVGEGVDGVLRLDSAQAGAYTQDDLRFLDILLDLLTTAITNAKLFAQTQRLALTDGLTELYRRQPFLEQLAREIARAGRSREPLSILMVDIDHFKRYNDTFGHSAGDVVLKAVAGVLRKALPPDGLCARYGGEEFAILLPRASREAGADIAGHIREAVEAHVRAIGNGAGHPVTVSLGVASFPDDAQSDLELLRRSDQRLYHAKRSGRNRVCSS